MTLTELRKSKDLSKSEVARRMEKDGAPGTYQNVSRLEETGTGPITTLEAYAAALEVTFADVYNASRATRGLPPDESMTLPRAESIVEKAFCGV